MSTLCFSFFAGTIGIIDLRAQLFDTTGANVGAAISAGFVEIGSGFYIWSYSSIPSAHRGGVKFYRNADPSTILNICSINPEEGEYVASIVAKVTDILADTGTDGVAIATATMNALADAILGRSVTNVQDTASIYTVAGLILAQFESSAPGTTWTIYKTDGSTVFATRALTEDANAKPVVSVT